MSSENQVSEKVLDAAFEIHRELGPGLLESVYEAVLEETLRSQGFEVSRQVAIPFRFKNLSFDEGFRADLIVNGKVMVELKSVRALEPVFAMQLRTYLRLTGLKLGLLINFNEVLLKNGIRRVVNGLEEVSGPEGACEFPATTRRRNECRVRDILVPIR